MSHRRLVPLLAAVAAGLSALGCAEQSAAVRVGDLTVSEPEMTDELDAYGENEALFAPGGQSAQALRGELAGSYSQQFVTEIVQQRIQFMLVEQVFEDQGLELTQADRSEAEQSLATDLGPGFEEFPAEYREGFVDDVARYNALGSALGAGEFDAAILEAAGDTEISVSSHFGEWDESTFSVVAPAGSTPAPTEAGDRPAGADGTDNLDAG